MPPEGTPADRNGEVLFAEEDLVPLSALQHWLFCPRQCALIHLEQAWEENKFTAEGRALHERAHEGPDESRPGVRITRGLPVRSLRLGVSGQCDVVEFPRRGPVLPIEYKRGKPKAHRADEVQVCAQAMCLEEMLGLPEGGIPLADLYYGERRRRTEVVLDAELRQLTALTAASIHEMHRVRATPPPVYEKRKCDACSLINLCLPQTPRASRWLAEQMRKSEGRGG